MTGIRRLLPATVYFSGEIDISTAADMRDAITWMITAGQAWPVADLSGVTFMDVAGVNALFAVQRAAAAAGGSLTLQAPSRQVRRLLAVFCPGGKLPAIPPATVECAARGSNSEPSD